MRKPLILLLLACPYWSQAQTPATADIKFDDGSCVRMTILHESIDVQTKYGKLTIPVADIRRVDFGLHVKVEQQVTIDRALKLLGSNIHKERVAASADLFAAGHFAAPSLRWASKSADPEIAKRAAGTLAKIADVTPAALLELGDRDTIHTCDGTIRGVVLLPTVKTFSPHFGEAQLQLHGLRSIHVLRGNGLADVVVDAAKYGDAWLDSGVVLDAGMRLLVTADGFVDLWPQAPGQYPATPKGYNTAGKGGQFMAGTLIGRIGENGKHFLIGERFDGSVNEEGRLYVQIIPSPWNAPSVGSYRARVQVGWR